MFYQALLTNTFVRTRNLLMKDVTTTILVKSHKRVICRDTWYKYTVKTDISAKAQLSLYSKHDSRVKIYLTKSINMFMHNILNNGFPCSLITS